MPTYLGIDSPAIRLRDDALLTVSFVASRLIHCKNANTVKIILQVDFQSATSVELQAQTREDEEAADGTVVAGPWVTKGVVIAPTAAGVSPLTLHTVQLTQTDFGAGVHDISFEILVSADADLRIRAKLTGTADATLQIDAVRGQGT